MTPVPRMDAKVQELLAKQELHENLLRYCRGMDRRDLELMRSTYWPEAWEDHGMFVGLSHEFCEWAMGVQREGHYRSSHYVSNVLIELHGPQAKRESAFIYLKVPSDGSPTDVLGGRYRDLCELRDGVWKVISRTCIWDWAQRWSPDADFQALFGIPPEGNFGRLYPDDPIYASGW